MKHNFGKKLGILVLVCILLAGAMTAGGVPLAQTGAGIGDKYLGVQLAYECVETEGFPAYEEFAVSYGVKTTQIDGLGSVTSDRMIVVGEWKGQEEGYVFPGVKGYNFFLVEVENGDGESNFVRWNNGMFGGHLTVHGDEGYTLEGTVYFGPELEDDAEKFYVWSPHEVYQMADGTVYMLADSGQSYGPKGGVTITEKRETTAAVNGRQQKQTLEIAYKMEWTERVTAVEVRQFDENDVLVSRTCIPTADSGKELAGALHPDAKWLIVQEITETGAGEKTVYAMDDKAENGAIYHSLILLDETGMGYTAKLVLQ